MIEFILLTNIWQAKTQSTSTPASKQLTLMIKQSALDELPNSDKGNFTTKNKYILSNAQQASNEIPVERTKRKKRLSKKFQGTDLQESVEGQFELTSPSQRTTGQEINIFYTNFTSSIIFATKTFYYFFANRISNYVNKTYHKI